MHFEFACFYFVYSFEIETINTFIRSLNLVPSKIIPDWGGTYLYGLYRGVPHSKGLGFELGNTGLQAIRPRWLLYTKKLSVSDFLCFFLLSYFLYFSPYLPDAPNLNLEPTSNKRPSCWEENLMSTYNTRHKSWNTCVIFLFPNVDLGITVVSLVQNTRGSTLGKERGKFKWERRCQEWV